MTTLKHTVASALTVATLLFSSAQTQADSSPIAEVPATFLSTLTASSGASLHYATPLLDRKRGYVYLIGYTDPGSVTKIRLGSDSATPPALAATLILNTGENQPDYMSAALDEENGYLYIGTGTTPGSIVKVAVGEGDATPIRLGALPLQAGENPIDALAIDPVNGFGYAAASGTPDTLVKFALGEGDALPTRVGATPFAADDSNLVSAVLDPARGKVWFGNGTSPNRIVQFSLGAGSALPTRDGALELPSPLEYFYDMAYDPLNQILFVPADTGAGDPSLTRVNVSGNLPQYAGTLFVDPAIDSGYKVTIDRANRVGFATTGDDKVVKFSLGERFAGTGLLQVLEIPTATALAGIIVDPVSQHVIVGETNADPGLFHILKQPLPASGVNLAGSVLKVAAKTGNAKESVKGQISVANTAAGSPDAGTFLVRYYLSADRELSWDDLLIGKQVRVKSLKAGKTRKVSFNFTSTTEKVAGKYVIAVIDVLDEVRDINRADNFVIAGPF